MMRLWRYRVLLESATRTSAPPPDRKVWLSDVRFPSLVPFAREVAGFRVVETRVVLAQELLPVPVPGQSTLIDESNRVWFVQETAQRSFRSDSQVEVSLARYDVAVGLGYDVPEVRANHNFVVPAGWTWVDGGGVPVQVLQCWKSTRIETPYGPASTFRLRELAGDTGTAGGGMGVFELSSGTVPTFVASHRQRGGRRRAGALVFGGGTEPWLFSPNGFGTRIDERATDAALAALGASRGVDAAVEVGDYFVIAG